MSSVQNLCWLMIRLWIILPFMHWCKSSNRGIPFLPGFNGFAVQHPPFSEVSCPMLSLKYRIPDDVGTTNIFPIRQFHHKYPLVNVYITMERSTMLLMGKTMNSISIFRSKLSVYQRVGGMFTIPSHGWYQCHTS